MAFQQNLVDAPRHPVRSEPLKDGKPEERRRAPRIRWDRVPVFVVGCFLLLLWWAAGGKYTIDGLPLFFNTILDFFHVPARLAPIADWRWYVRLCWLPVVISIIERRNRPRRGLAWSLAMVYAIGVWVVVSGVDLGSTWLAVRNPRPDDWLIARQAAASPVLSGLWTGMTTFLPEIGMAALWRYVRS